MACSRQPFVLTVECLAEEGGVTHRLIPAGIDPVVWASMVDVNRGMEINVPTVPSHPPLSTAVHSRPQPGALWSLPEAWMSMCPSSSIDFPVLNGGGRGCWVKGVEASL